MEQFATRGKGSVARLTSCAPSGPIKARQTPLKPIEAHQKLGMLSNSRLFKPGRNGAAMEAQLEAF